MTLFTPLAMLAPDVRDWFGGPLLGPFDGFRGISPGPPLYAATPALALTFPGGSDRNGAAGGCAQGRVLHP